MTQISLLFKGESFLFGESTMTEAFRADLEDRLTLGGRPLRWSSFHVRLALCPGHTVSISQMHTTSPWLMHADSSPYNYYDVEIVAPGCHDAYDGARRASEGQARSGGRRRCTEHLRDAVQMLVWHWEMATFHVIVSTCG